MTTPTKVGAYSLYSGNSLERWVVRYGYTADLNGDGTDEVIFAGFETQPNTPTEYDNTRLLVFGWQDGKLVNRATTWLPNGMDQVQGVGDIQFGDFNKDGLLDFFTSSYTDMNHPVHSYVFLNRGGRFDRLDLGTDQWQHNAVVHDINRDGFDDVLTIGWGQPRVYIGGPSGLTRHEAGGPLFGAGIAVGDFLGDGSLSAVVTDWAVNRSVQDIVLLKINENFNLTGPGSRVNSELVSHLPAPAMGNTSHDIRARPLDFNNDGRLDVVVFSTSDHTVTTRSSAVQFLENTGGGVFRDVTSQRLVGYDTTGTTTYTPIFRDFNGDGQLDIFSLDAHWEIANSTRFLMGSPTGTFVESGRQSLSALIPKTAVATVAKGPDGKFHLVWDAGSRGMADIYSAPLSFTDNSQITAVPPAGNITTPTPPVVTAPVPPAGNITTPTPPVVTDHLDQPRDGLVDVNRSDGVTRFKDLRRSKGVEINNDDVLDMTVLEQDLGIDLWFSGNRAPGWRTDATGAVWERGNVIYVSTDRDNQAEWWCRVVGVQDVDGDNFWFG